MKIKKKLKSSDFKSILDSFDESNQNHTSDISHPASGDVYLFFKKDGANDYKVDGWKWVHQSSTVTVDQVKISYYRSCVMSPSGSFKKRTAKLLNVDLPVVVEYSGNDELNPTTAHGNANDQNGKFQRTLPSTLHSLKQKLESSSASNVYKTCPIGEKPRNARVCSNIKYVSIK